MADSLVACVAEAGSDASAGTGAGSLTTRSGARDVAVRLLMTERALLDGDDEPAHLDGYGPVPAAWARDLVCSTLERTSDQPESDARAEARVFVTRLVTDTGGALVCMESRARTAPAGLADLIRTRDGGTCRTSWCDAPVRHVDHVIPHARGGLTSADNAQGLCERCNHVKTALGWHAEVTDPPPGLPGRHTVVTTTPTGHRYRSQAPPLPGADGSAGIEEARGNGPPRGSVIEMLQGQLDLTA